MPSSPVLLAIKLSRLNKYIVNKAGGGGVFVRSPTCNQVLFTYDVSHVINLPGSPPEEVVQVYGICICTLHLQVISVTIRVQEIQSHKFTHLHQNHGTWSN